MMPSIRVRLTAWYVGVLAVATLVLGAASWWLPAQSIVRATDANLTARIDGVRDFLTNPRTRLSVDDLQEEFGEYAELTRGEALLDVVGPSDVILCRPSVAGWGEMKAALSGIAAASPVFSDRRIAEHPYRVGIANLKLGGQSFAVTVAAPMGPAYAALGRFRRWLLVLVPLVLIVAAAGGYGVSRRALAPVDQMTRAVQTITLDHLDRRLAIPPGNDELSRLASTFNDVLSRLDGAVRDIVRFTADASHELRTPVALVRTTAEVALRHERPAHEYRQALVEVAAHAGQMSELVGDLLVLARTDAGLESLALVPQDLRELLQRTCREMTELGRARGLRVEAALPATPVIVPGDAAGLHRLFVILLDNALTYSVAGSLVCVNQAVDPSAEAGRTIVEIRDQGIGLDSVDEPRLFERFFRGQRARQHAPAGTGLGLAIARTIVTRHGGSIELGPAGRGASRGCCVTVVLPTVSEEGPAARRDGLAPTESSA